MCKFFPILFYANIFISAISMTFVALNRYFGVFHSHRMKKVFSRKNCCIMVTAIWVFVFCMMLLPLFEVSMYGVICFCNGHMVECCLIKDKNSRINFLPYLLLSSANKLLKFRDLEK